MKNEADTEKKASKEKVKEPQVTTVIAKKDKEAVQAMVQPTLKKVEPKRAEPQFEKIA